MQFIDLAAQQQRIRERIEERIKTVLDHGQYIMGPEVAELEAALAEFTHSEHCVSCASGTDALLMTLMAWGIGPGDAVFVPAFSFFATAEVVALLGATPVMVDIDAESFMLDATALEKAVTAVLAGDSSLYPIPMQARESRLAPKAAIPVDLFGQCADYSALLPVAERHGLPVLEDAAQSFGAEHRGKKSCNLGCHAAATSFFPAKPLGAYGDGGAIFTNDADLAQKLRSIRTHGKGSDKYDNVRIGVNGRLDTLQAAILLTKLEIFPEEVTQRQKVASFYANGLATVPHITTPGISHGNSSAWAQYCILVQDGSREALMASLKAKGIPCNIYYPTPMHMLTAFDSLGYSPEDMPVSLRVSKNILALPFHPYMAQEQVETVVQTIAEHFS